MSNKITNNHKETFAERVKKSRVNIGLTQTDLAKSIGVSRQQIANYEKGGSSPRADGLNKLSAALGVSAEWLRDGTGDKSSSGSRDIDFIHRKVPVISWSDTASRLEKNNPTINACSWVFPPTEVSQHAFALLVRGDSMLNPHGSPSFPEKSIVIVDPMIDPLSGDIVVCAFKSSGEVTMKKLIIDSGQKYLKPLNPAYPNMPVEDDDFIVVGVVTHSVQMILNR